MASPSTPAALLCLLLSLHLLLLSSPTSSEPHPQHRHLTRKLHFSEEEEDQELDEPLPPPPKKKTSTLTTKSSTIAEGKNQTKLLKPPKLKKANSTTADTAAARPPPSKSSLNKTLTAATKLLRPSNSTKLPKPPKAANSTAIKLPKSPKTLNSTATAAAKASKKAPDLPLPKANKTQSTTPKPKKPPPAQQQQQSTKGKPKPAPVLSWSDAAGDDPSEEETDLIAEFRELPSRFHQTLLPDLEKFSTTSKVYLSRANKEITRGVKPLVGNRYAPAVASATSALFLVLPLLLVAALLHQVRSYLSLPRILLFVHAYLAIYFVILAFTAVLTGLEPLRLFYATSPGPYVYTQVLQTLGYVLFLLLQLMHLVVAFATTPTASPEGAATRALALVQLVVGLAVGLHYYTAVFHRAVVGEPPRTNWRVHGLYAACFLAICIFARAAERRKKAYLLGGPGSDVSKKS